MRISRVLSSPDPMTDEPKPDSADATTDAADQDAEQAREPVAASSSSQAQPVQPGPPRQRRIVELVLIIAGVLVLDLWSKAWAWEALRDGASVTVIENWFYFEFGFNTGSAFSFLRDASYARTTFILVTILALVYMAWLAATLPTRFRSAFIAVGMVTGGALGNLHDRLFRIMEIRGEMRHGVVDFIKVFYWKGKVWPTFNIADVALVVGIGMLFIFISRHGDALDAAKAARKT